MDDQEKALNDQAEAETAEDTTPVSEETTEDVSTSEDDSKKKKGYQARVRELNARAKAAEATVQNLSERLAAYSGGIPQVGYRTQQNRPLVEPGEEITAEELNRRQAEREQQLLQMATQANSLETQRALALDRVNRESRELTRRYEELNPNSDNFDPELSTTVTEAAEAYVRANPTKSLEDFVDKQMKLYKRSVAKEAKAESTEIARQSGQSAIRPSTAKPAEKQFEELTIEEMEAKLGYFKG